MPTDSVQPAPVDDVANIPGDILDAQHRWMESGLLGLDYVEDAQRNRSFLFRPDMDPEQLGERFRVLATRWRQERPRFSSLTTGLLTPAYREIIDLGWGAVPLIIGALRDAPDHWFVALAEITGANPVPEAARGDVAAMAREWAAWWSAVAGDA